MSQSWKVYVARKLPEPLETMLKPSCAVEMNEQEVLEPREAFLKRVRGIDALITDSRVIVNEEVFEAAGQRLKIVSNAAVGFNNIDVAEAARRGITVTNTPGVVSNATADIALALMFSAARRVAEGDRMVRTKVPWTWTPTFMLGRDIVGKTLGIVGAGRIGTVVAKRANAAFEMKIIYSGASTNESLEKEFGATKVDFDTLLKESDFISVHVPLTPETRHMFGASQFALMKNTAILINTSRGPVVDEKALAAALRQGTIWGAGLDVYEKEPNITPELAELENIVMTPHIGTATPDTRKGMAVMAAQNVLDFMAGKIPKGLVNPKARSSPEAKTGN